eukprot:gb/GEZN01029051.1/.p1 GENE.gb/GEZN01029051.1/~~gb/GEZN01029051.1/.p1  ORF type:complete len:107 (-),score=16.63 gb/GEZN01029051.1/:58-378(-)
MFVHGNKKLEKEITKSRGPSMGFVGAAAAVAAQASWGGAMLLVPNPAVKAYGVFVLCPGPGWAATAAAGAVAEEAFLGCFNGSTDCVESAKTKFGEIINKALHRGK